MRRWLTVGTFATVVALMTVAVLWPAAPSPASAQTAPDVRLRETPASLPDSGRGAEPSQGRVSLTLRLSSATLSEERRALGEGADVTLLAQPTYVALPGAGPNLLRVSPAFTVTARDAGGHDIELSPAARLTFIQPNAEGASVLRLEGDSWRAVPAVRLGHALIVQPARPGTYAVFAELPAYWPLRNDLLTAVALNAARLVVDDLATQP